MIVLYHYPANHSMPAILESETLLANSPSDVFECVFRASRIAPWRREAAARAVCKCPHSHHYLTPTVLWLTDRTDGHTGEGARRFRIALQAPVSVQRWTQWAQTHGADPEWMARKQRIDPINEWVTPTAVPRAQWLEIYDFQRDRTINPNAPHIK